MAVIFGIQFVDRSFGPILPLYVEQLGVGRARVPLASGLLFSLAACSGAIGHHFCGRLLKRTSARTVISAAACTAAAGAAVMAASGSTAGLWFLAAGIATFGVGLGTAMTAAYTAAGSVMPAGVHGTGFGLLSSASLAGLAISPVASGFIAATSMRAIFLFDVIVMALLAVVVRRSMATEPARGGSRRQGGGVDSAAVQAAEDA
jgi:MFS family permease